MHRSRAPKLTVLIGKKALRAMKRAGVRPLVTGITVTVTDAEHQRTVRRLGARIRR